MSCSNDAAQANVQQYCILAAADRAAGYRAEHQAAAGQRTPSFQNTWQLGPLHSYSPLKPIKPAQAIRSIYCSWRQKSSKSALHSAAHKMLRISGQKTQQLRASLASRASACMVPHTISEDMRDRHRRVVAHTHARRHVSTPA